MVVLAVEANRLAKDMMSGRSRQGERIEDKRACVSFSTSDNGFSFDLRLSFGCLGEEGKVGSRWKDGDGK